MSIGDDVGGCEDGPGCDTAGPGSHPATVTFSPGLPVLVVVVFLLGGCAPNGVRPAVPDWSVTWRGAQDLVPARESLATPPDDQLCEQVLVSLRAVRDQLVPTPDELVDSAVRAWLAQAEHMFFECFSAAASDRPTVAYATLDRLRRQVDEALESAAASQGGGEAARSVRVPRRPADPATVVGAGGGGRAVG